MKSKAFKSMIALSLLTVSLSGCWLGLVAWPLWIVGAGVATGGAAGMIMTDPYYQPHAHSAAFGVFAVGVLLGENNRGRIDGLNTLPIETNPQTLAQLGITTQEIRSYNRYLASNTESLQKVAKEVVKDLNSLKHIKGLTTAALENDSVANSLAQKYGFKNVSEFLDSFKREKLPADFRIHFAKIYNIDPDMSKVFLVHTLGVKTE